LELNIGTCTPFLNEKNLTNCITYIENNREEITASLAKYSKVIKAKIAEKEDIYYWIDYALEIGVDHFSNKYFIYQGFIL